MRAKTMEIMRNDSPTTEYVHARGWFWKFSCRIDVEAQVSERAVRQMMWPVSISFCARVASGRREHNGTEQKGSTGEHVSHAALSALIVARVQTTFPMWMWLGAHV